jgi:hypothetical protein
MHANARTKNINDDILETLRITFISVNNNFLSCSFPRIVVFNHDANDYNEQEMNYRLLQK